MANLADTIPGYAEALSRERELRELALLGRSVPIAGVAVVPLTMRRLSFLRLAKNAFVCGSGPCTAAHAAQFLWVVSTAFAPGDNQARDIFLRSVASLPAREVYDGIHDYLENAFFDIEQSGEGGGRAPISSWEASVIDTLASEYGWARDAIMDTPIAEISQYLRLIEHRRGHPVINPMSDGVKMKWLEQLNTPSRN